MQSPLIIPFLSMMLLTALVWLAMLARRITFMNGAKIGAEELKQPDDVARVLPAGVANIGHNFKNLFELPVLFYALCLYLMSLPQLASGYVMAAWVFVGLRVLHSLVQCTYNRVMHRFIAYILSSVALWFMLVKALLDALS